MLGRAQSFVGERAADTLKVWLPNGIVLATVNLVTLKSLAELGLILLSIAYTAWRWRRDARKG